MTASPQDGPIVIIGAGMAGLGAATTLRRAGFDVTVLERHNYVGGLARSIAYGDHIFDVGPHYFFLDVSDDVNALIRSCMGPGEWRPIDFKISALIGRHDVAWPPSLSAAFKMPLRGILQYVKLSLQRRVPESFVTSEYLQGAYGSAMYRIFLDPYLRKKCPVSDGANALHRDWYAQTTRTIHNVPDVKRDKMLQFEPALVEQYLDRYPEVRAAAERRRQEAAETGESDEPERAGPIKHAFNVVRGLTKLAAKKDYKKVLYPPGGVGVIVERVADDYVAQGGKLELRAANVQLNVEGKRVRSVTWDGGSIEAPAQVIWTGSVHRLCSMLEIPREELPFMTIMLCMMKLDRPLPDGDALYTYVADPEIPFNRIYYPNRSVEGLCPPGKDSLCVEISPTDFKDEADPERLWDKIASGLEKLGVCRREHVTEHMFMFVPDSYPVYPLDYREKLDRIWEQLDTFPNLRSIGRSGQFWYNNMAKSMRAGVEVAQDLLGEYRP